MATTADNQGSRLDERELRAWRGLLRVHAALTKTLDAELETGHGLPLSSYEVLMHLHDAESHRMRMHDLAQTVLLSRSGLTRLVDRLEREGLLERASCPSDARGAYAVLTPKGVERIAAARATHLASVRRRFLEHLTPGELDLLGELWERVLPDAHAPGGTCGSSC